MNWHEDFQDEPSIEERTPYGLCPIEMHSIMSEVSLEECGHCEERFPSDEMIVTGIYEYYTMDLDPDTRLCEHCYECHRQSCIPDDPAHFDSYTPVKVR
ncbi:MAG: hypothetical protein SGJ20_02880 [Planctomycetota bacterium]|nr:hypothetical protein [Planctomycetota bacterium]